MAADDGALSFPDEARGQLDRVLSELVDRAGDVMKTQGRLRALIKANQAVVEHLELAVVLKRIVEAAVELVGAEYGALGVIAPDGALEQFINVGMTANQVHDIGPLPTGHGLLGAVIDDAKPIRLAHLSQDPRSYGFPAAHPPMDSFLGVPIRVRDEVYGNLYLSNQASGRFSVEDEQLVASLAATAGFAIDNARLFAETQRRQAWSAASAEITGALLSAEQADSMAILVSRVLQLASADLVCVVLPSENPLMLRVGVAEGLDSDTLAGLVFPVSGSVSGSVIEGKQPRLVNNGDRVLLDGARSFGPMMAVPLIAAGMAEGVLVVARVPGGARFTAPDLEMAANFAGQASVAMELAKARAAQQRMVLLEDRGRIARDLHDHVIQQLFGTGLELQSIAGSLEDRAGSQRVLAAVNTLDVAITQIRTAIFALSATPAGSEPTVRHRLIDLAGELAATLSHTPRVEFSGPVDLVIVGTLADDVVAVSREALTNSAKHARAANTSLALTVSNGAVLLEIVDDGVGTVPTSRRSGLANLESRARKRGGTFVFDSSSTGTRINWTVPFDLEVTTS